MLSRLQRGLVPSRPHTVLPAPDGSLYYEHCLTRDGFDGPFTIAYQRSRPQALSSDGARRQLHVAQTASLSDPLARRHFPMHQARGPESGETADSASSRRSILFNDDVVIGLRTPTLSDAAYFLDAEWDQLLYVQRGRGALISPFGRLPFHEEDYVFVPKGVVHRFDVEGEQLWLSMEVSSRLRIPRQYLNEVGQLVMGAPYSERDFRVPVFRGIVDEGIRRVWVRHGAQLIGRTTVDTPLDWVGFDGAVYPFAFPIRAFRPRVGATHLPPTVHTTFETPSLVVCSFVPRPLDFGENAIPCPYPHSSVDMDEVLFYSQGRFTSRIGVGVGSVTFHPRGTPHGPHPGRYEASLGESVTEELAVMLDTRSPLSVAEDALRREDPNYESSFLG